MVVSKFILQNIAHYGDILAIPMFLIIIYYFNIKKNKTKLEKLILLFLIIAFFADIIFTLLHFYILPKYY